MASVVITPTPLSAEERAELDWLLQSGVLGRSANASKVLRYICEETGAGRGDHIKEYSIAVEALGRKANFDPQTDTIVRVTVHNLRKRLQEVYESGEGASHAVRLVIPTGGYAAHFIHMPEVVEEPKAEDAVERLPPAGHVASQTANAERGLPWLWFVLIVVTVVAGGVAWRWRSAARTQASDASAATVITGPAHLLIGPGRKTYMDRSGVLWTPRQVCEGGEEVRPAGIGIGGTEDSYIYDGGLRGIVRCTLHVQPGFYELRLHFAEPSDLEPAQRVVNLSLNAGPPQTIDVVDRAGGDREATTVTLPGINPENDGTIHLDFTTEVSPINAIEVIPTASADPLPIRIVASSRPFVDDQRQVWMSDRYFRGGRRGQTPDPQHRPNHGLYAADRVGTFKYAVPAPPGSKYRVTLYFREPWFGQANGPRGGAGSRVFNVYVNGEVFLQNFDILAEGHGQPVVKTIENVSPTARGLLNLEFVPVVNYPVVNAIEITPEHAQ